MGEEDATAVDVDPEFDVVQAPPTADIEAGVLSVDTDDDFSVIVEGGGGASSAAARMVDIARDQQREGVAENPPGSNRGVPLERYVHWFSPGSGPVPWCAYFVSWAWDQATDRNRRVPWSNPGYVGSILEWGRSSGRTVDQPQHGDLFGLGDDHVGIVAGSDPNRRMIYSVEGNYSSRVAGVNRSWSGLWFVRLP